MSTCQLASPVARRETEQFHWLDDVCTLGAPLGSIPKRMSISGVSRAQVSLPPAGTRAPGVQRAAPKQVDGFEAGRPVAVALRRGATGAAVRAMQLKLIAKGLLSRGDFSSGAGVFGPRTETAVKRLQTEHGLPVTGVLDARSSAALNAERVVKQEKSIAEVITDVFEKPGFLAQAAQTVTDDDDEVTVAPPPLAKAG